MICENMSIWCWLIPAIVGLICAILGYLLGTLSRKTTDSDDSEANYKKKISKLESDLAACKAIKTKVSKTADSSGATLIPFDAAAAKLVFGKKVKKDDLKMIEGIGSKIEELFQNHQIKTWKKLSETSVDRCQEILNSEGERFRVHIPTTWPKQAKLAYQGKWEKLLKWQDELDGGK
jgi:predicted flap endonuclease-1-like 5' DNA nuclease